MTTQFHAIDKNMIAALRNLRTVAIQEQVNATMGNFVTSAKARHIELNVSGISEPFRIKPNLQEVVDYVNAFRRTAPGRALIALVWIWSSCSTAHAQRCSLVRSRPSSSW